MSIPIPKLDDRSYADIREEAIRLVTRYCPQWTNHNASDPGITLIELFAWMTEMKIYRINRVPDKMYRTLLNLVGIDLQMPKCATTWVQFALAESHEERSRLKTQLVSAGTPIATDQTESTDAVVFETMQDVQLTNLVLDDCFSLQLRENPKAYFMRQHALDPVGRFREPATPFGGENMLPSDALLIGDDALTLLNQGATVNLRFLSRNDEHLADMHKLFKQIDWQIWSDIQWESADSFRIKKETGKGKSSGYISIEFDGTSSPLTPREIPVIDSTPRSWARAIWKELPANKELSLTAAGIQLTAERDQIPIREAFREDSNRSIEPIDVTGRFKPFGNSPGEGSKLYLACADLLRHKGATVQIDIETSKKEDPDSSLKLFWEYSREDGSWGLLGQTMWHGGASGSADKGTHLRSEFIIGDKDGNKSDDLYLKSDTTKCFTQNGSITFTVPDDIHTADYLGLESYWLRVRIDSGAYDSSMKGQSDAHIVVKRQQGSDSKTVETITHTVEEAQHTHPEINRISGSLRIGYTAPAGAVRYHDFGYSALDTSNTTKSGIELISSHNSTGDASGLYIGFDKPIPDTPISLYFKVREPQILPRNHDSSMLANLQRTHAKETQLLEWSVWGGKSWRTIQVVDETDSLTTSGTVRISCSFTSKSRVLKTSELYWLRIKPLSESLDFPELLGVHLNAVRASHLTTIPMETLGVSDGLPGQVFNFQQRPVLSQKLLISDTDHPEEIEKQAESLEWQEVDNFFQSNADDPHYIIDAVEGTARFGDGRAGKIPPTGAFIVAHKYSTGGGTLGNVSTGALRNLRRSISYVSGVSNLYPATGGGNLETVEQAMQRAPYIFKHRDRAVTVEDFEWLCKECAGEAVTKVKPQIDQRDPGSVRIVIVPASGLTDVQVLELCKELESYLDERRLITTRVSVEPVEYRNLYIEVIAGLTAYADPRGVRNAALSRVVSYLDPLSGGKMGQGWEFGQSLYPSEITALLNSIDGIRFIRDTNLKIDDQGGRNERRVDLRKNELFQVEAVSIKTDEAD